MESLENGKGDSWESTPVDHSDNGPGGDDQTENRQYREPRPRKPLAFYMSFLALLIMGFICALDATVLGVATPVS